MSGQDTQREGAVTFLPHHLNRQPVVVRGLTADELWVCAGLSAAVGLALVAHASPDECRKHPTTRNDIHCRWGYERGYF